jgi:hypothetical protein
VSDTRPVTSNNLANKGTHLEQRKDIKTKAQLPTTIKKSVNSPGVSQGVKSRRDPFGALLLFKQTGMTLSFSFWPFS